jgi:hypothetical protein
VNDELIREIDNAMETFNTQYQRNLLTRCRAVLATAADWRPPEGGFSPAKPEYAQSDYWDNLASSDAGFPGTRGRLNSQVGFVLCVVLVAVAIVLVNWWYFT